MKTLQFLLLFISVLAFSQNDMKARIEYEEAETAFAAEDYSKAITHLTEAEKLLGEWTPKVGYLMIVSLDKTLDYGSPDEDVSKILISQVKKYMQYAAKKKDVDMDKFKEANAVEKRVNSLTNLLKEENDSDYKNGQDAFEKENYQEAIDYYRKAADKGNYSAMANLAWYYRNGKGIAQNESKAMELYKKAADKGNINGMGYIGRSYYKDQNYQEAMEWFKKSEEKGSASACYNIGTYYLVVSKDYNEALQWLKKAAQKGHSGSMNNIATMYYSGQGVSQNYQEAMKWFSKAAEKDNVTAMGQIAYFYMHGYGVTQNCEKSIQWNLKVVEKGKADGGIYYGLGECYFYLKNYEKAMEWLLKAYEETKSGEVHSEEYKKLAKNRIAEMYEGGLSVKKDKKLAKEWRNK